MKLLGRYKNGNYNVAIFNDGTKIRETEANEFIPSFAENCDVKITSKCDGKCPYCYEGCTPNGKHGDILNNAFLNELHPYTEMAINGNDLSHPDLKIFLELLKLKKVITNMTVNQRHFLENIDFIKELVDNKLIYGLGISLVNPTEEFLNKVKLFPNVVIHVIAGLVTPEQIDAMRGRNLKVLILGYKRLRRGEDYYCEKSNDIYKGIKWLTNNLKDLTKDFDVISFDNLAIQQLEVRKLFSDKDWEEFYMGDDGKFTFYIDLVEKTFAKNSLSTERFSFMDNIDDMFKKVREL